MPAAQRGLSSSLKIFLEINKETTKNMATVLLRERATSLSVMSFFSKFELFFSALLVDAAPVFRRIILAHTTQQSSILT